MTAHQSYDGGVRTFWMTLPNRRRAVPKTIGRQLLKTTGEQTRKLEEEVGFSLFLVRYGCAEVWLLSENLHPPI